MNQDLGFSTDLKTVISSSKQWGIYPQSPLASCPKNVVWVESWKAKLAILGFGEKQGKISPGACENCPIGMLPPPFC